MALLTRQPASCIGAQSRSYLVQTSIIFNYRYSDPIEIDTDARAITAGELQHGRTV